MNKDTKESVLAIITLAAIFAIGVLVGEDSGWDKGFAEGVTVNHGDKWDCAYSYSTGFLMCDRTPKYK